MAGEEDQFKRVEEHTLLEVGSESKDLKSSSQAPSRPGGEALSQTVDIHFGIVRATRLLGAGGMGKVYRGRHEGLDIDVAIKVMSGDLAKDTTARQRFMREARTAARLDHPNVVRVLTVDEKDGAPYIVMEFVDGSDLAALVKQAGRLAPVPTLQALAQVADGLAAAHEQGIIHRDIKPHNIFVSRQGRVKLGDFGLARATEQTTELTLPGSAMGTANYMSPEQAQGQELGPRSDVYSLGITAYHLLSGQTPYTGTTPLSIAVQHVNNDVPFDRARFGHVPDPAVYLLIAMTARDAAKRPSAAEVAAQLRAILRQVTGRDEVRLPNLDVLTQHAGATTLPTAPPVVPPAPQPTFAPATPPVPPAPPFQTPRGPLAPPGFTQGPLPRFVPPPGPLAAGSAGSTPSQPLPMQWQQPKGSNALLWVAIAIVVLVILMFAGCGMIMATQG
ncbi:MAG: serine/threonine protein kinase [Planctomycetota bacterium]|nr:MAG: serine/threonine protein kinase [Planctomycetota bacterium]